MHPDVVDLRRFYESTLGKAAAATIQGALAAMWPDLRAMRVIGLGYAAPYLESFIAGGAAGYALAPPGQGAITWPAQGPGRMAFAQNDELPFADCSIDRVLIVHSLQGIEPRRTVLREIWRVLASGGRLLVAAPNRRGLWARSESTPFWHDTPYSVSQLQGILREHLFVPEQASRCLYFPPLGTRMILQASGPLERVGKRVFPTFGGLTMVEASKQVYGLTGNGAGARSPRWSPRPAVQ